MKHIKTASDAETTMRKSFPVASAVTPIVAEDSHLKLLARIVELTRQMDLIKLEISQDMGTLMGYMQHHAVLQDADGRILVTWNNGAEKKVVDYDGIFLEMNVPPAVIAAHTTKKPGARVFTIVSD